MLNPAQVAPFLQSEDAFVRKLAGQYLSQAHDPSPATAEDAWRMIDRFGAGEEHSSNYGLLSKLPQTEASLDRTLKELAAEKDEDRKNHLEEALVELPYGLFLRFRDRIEGSTGLSDDFRAYLARRIELATVPPQELWDQLMSLGQEVTRNWSETEGFDPRPPRQLIEALARSPESAQWALATLGDNSIEGFRALFAVEMLGQLRFRAAADLVIDKLLSNPEAEFLLESCTDALIRMGGTQVVAALVRRWKEMAWGVKLYACDILSGLKLKEAETALTELLNQETDQPLRTKIAIALCDTAATDPKALEKLREMVSTGRWDVTMTDLDQEVVALFTMIGHHIPELPQWRAKVSDPEAMKNRRKKAYGQMLKSSGQDISQVPNDWEADESPWGSDDKVISPSSAPPVAAVKPIRREAAKVGRNDPCPCGSGKKYKKCCGK